MPKWLNISRHVNLESTYFLSKHKPGCVHQLWSAQTWMCPTTLQCTNLDVSNNEIATTSVDHNMAAFSILTKKRAQIWTFLSFCCCLNSVVCVGRLKKTYIKCLHFSVFHVTGLLSVKEKKTNCPLGICDWMFQLYTEQSSCLPFSSALSSCQQMYNSVCLWTHTHTCTIQCCVLHSQLWDNDFCRNSLLGPCSL